MNDWRKRNEWPVQNTENRGGKNMYYLLLISYPLFCCWAEFIFRLRLKLAEKHAEKHASHNGEHALRLDEETPAGATETDTTSIYEYGSRTFMKNKYGANIFFTAVNFTLISAFSSQSTLVVMHSVFFYKRKM